MEDQGAVIAFQDSPVSGSLVRVYKTPDIYRDTLIGRARPDKPIKFAVGSPNLRSGLWRIWSTKKSDDVYVKAMSEESFTKISLHESGDWRHQITFERTAHPKVHWVRRPDPSSRVLDAWARPAPVNGWIEAFSLLIPSEDIVHVPNDPTKLSDVKRWITQPPAGECSEFRFFLVENTASARPFRYTSRTTGPITVVGAYRLHGGNIFLVTHNRTKLSTNEEQKLNDLRCNPICAPAPDFPLHPSTGPRSIAWTTYEDGHRVYFDLALFPHRNEEAVLAHVIS